MFIVASNNPAARRRSHIQFWLLLFGCALTMHLYVRPGPPEPKGFRVFGFLIGRKAALKRNTATGVRKVLIFLISTAMITGGLYLLVAETLWATRYFVALILGEAMLVVLGAYLLWADIVAPMLGVKTAEDGLEQRQRANSRGDALPLP